MQWNGKDGNNQQQLNVDNLKGMNGRHREHGRLLVLVVHLVKVLVQEGRVVDPVNPVSGIILVQEYHGNLQEQPPPAIVQPVVVEGKQRASVECVTRNHCRHRAGEHQGEAAKQDLVTLQIGRHKLVRLAFPLLGTGPLPDVEEPLEIIKFRVN